MQATRINTEQGSLLPALGTAMQLGYGPAETLCTARAQHAIHRPTALPQRAGSHLWGNHKKTANPQHTGGGGVSSFLYATPPP